MQAPWQKSSLALAADGMSGDLFWQWGDNLSNGPTSDDGNTIYYGSDLATCLITNHVADIEAAASS